jgi:hypothetical protein
MPTIAGQEEKRQLNDEPGVVLTAHWKPRLDGCLLLHELEAFDKYPGVEQALKILDKSDPGWNGVGRR